MLTGNQGLDIRLLGRAEVRVCCAPLPPLHSRRGLWLLALLALRAGKPVSRSKIAGLLWPDTDESTALQNLRQTLANLRSALGPLSSAVAAEQDRSLRLDLACAQVDVLAFDRACSEGSPSALERALELYSGPLLEDCDEVWAVEERQPRAAAFLVALERLAEARASTGDHAAAIACLRRAVNADPFRESARRALMTELTAAGELTAAQEVYRDLRDMLYRELNAQPDPQTTRVYQAIRQNPAPSEPPPIRSHCAGGTRGPATGNRPAPIPTPLTELIGREEEVRELKARLESARLVTLTGSGGIGKTRLALRLAAELQDQFEDGSCFVDLTTINDASLAPEVVRQAVGLTQAGTGPDQEEVLKAYLAPRNMLLVLDNCERLAPAYAALADRLLGCAARLKILATSRHALGLRGESLYRVPSLAQPPVQAAQGVEPSRSSGPDPSIFPAVRLFVERARACGAVFELTPSVLDSIVGICRRIDGIPLAIELAAARARSLSIPEINERLSKDFGLLQGGAAWGMERHQTLRAVFDWSWNLLAPEEQSALATLSSFAGSWTVDAAQGLLQAGELTLDLLASLVDKSLVVYSPGGTSVGEPVYSEPPGRYRLLETVRQFADDRLSESGQRDHVKNRHRDYYLGWAEDTRQRLQGPASAHWFDRFEAEHDNLRAAIDWCRARGDIEEELRLLTSLARFWDTHGHLGEGRARLESGMSRMTASVPAELRAALAGQAGWAALEQGDYAAAGNHFENCLSLQTACGKRSQAGGTLNSLACVAMRQDRLEEAMALFQESLSVARASGRSPGLAAVLNNMAELEMLRGNLGDAEAHLTEAAPICEAEGRTQLLGIVHGNLSVAALRAGRAREALDHSVHSIRSLHRAGAFVNLPSALRQMAAALVALAMPERAARLLGAADALADTLDVPAARDGEGPAVEQAAAAARCTMGVEEFDAEHRKGKGLSIEQSVEYALELA